MTAPKPEHLYIMQVPVISTAHLPSLTALEDAGILCAKYDEGWFVYVDDDPKEDSPQWLLDLQHWAVGWGYRWVRLDANGDVVPGLEVFD